MALQVRHDRYVTPAPPVARGRRTSAHAPTTRRSVGSLRPETASELPRGSDGAIRAGIEGVGRSISTARRGTTIYAGAAEIKGGSIATLKDGKVVRKGAKIGRTFTVKIFTRDGQSVT